MEPRLQKKYNKEIAPALQKELGISNKMAIPKVVKVGVNIGVSSRNTDSNNLDTLEETMVKITGQKPVRTKARKAISAFKLREGMVVGLKVTLRGKRMYDFLDKLVNVAIPRIRDFRGLSVKSIDQQGNLTLGFKEHNVFPEIRSDEVERVHGLEISVVTNANNHDEGLILLQKFGFPFFIEDKK
jgi:large subunit ribosomal protein L5